MTDTGPIPPSGVTPPTNPQVPPAGAPINSMSPVTEGGYMGPAATPDDRTMGMLAHLLGIIGFLGPLIIWLIKKDQSPFVNDQGKEALNFQLMVLIAWVVVIVTSFFCIGAILGPLVFIANIIFCIMAAMKGNQGIAYRYPFNIRFIK